MRIGRLLVVPAVLMTVGCMQGERIIKIKGDGSGTIVDTVKLGDQAKAMLGGMEQMDTTPADQKKAKKDAKLKAKAVAMGPGVTFVSVETMKDGSERVTWAFQDITKVKIGTTPEVSDNDAKSSDEPLTFRFAKTGGHSVLTVVSPPKKPTKAASGPPAKPEEMAKQIAQMKALMAGLKMTTAVDVQGTLVKTSSPYASGARVTLQEIDFDQFDEATLKKLAAAPTPQDMDPKMLAGLKGLKFAQGDVVIEFQPQ
jgi:hypothetical protein